MKAMVWVVAVLLTVDQDGLVVNIISCWVISTIVTHMLVTTVGKGKSWTMLLIPQCTDVSSTMRCSILTVR